MKVKLIKRPNGNVYTICHVVWLLTLTYAYDLHISVENFE